MSLLRSGKRTRIAGRDIGAGLQAIIRKFRAASVPALLGKIATWEAKEVARLEVMLNKATNGRKSSLTAKIEGVRDQAEMLISLTDGAKNVADVEARIAALFTDDGLGDAGLITCSSVHKAKGLEANRVFVLSDTLRVNTQEERNICYVAYTRAKNTLVFVR
jgi:superfamily I DNA/RNA helicase